MILTALKCCQRRTPVKAHLQFPTMTSPTHANISATARNTTENEKSLVGFCKLVAFPALEPGAFAPTAAPFPPRLLPPPPPPRLPPLPPPLPFFTGGSGGVSLTHVSLVAIDGEQAGSDECRPSFRTSCLTVNSRLSLDVVALTAGPLILQRNVSNIRFAKQLDNKRRFWGGAWPR